MAKRLLVTYAHPDDESFGLGAFLGKCAAEGIESAYVCTTNGDVGTVDPEKLKGYNSVAELRLAELACAAEILKFREVITFGYRDSGMMGSADNQHPNASWTAPDEEVTAKVMEVIRRIQPHVIITFDPFGGYGHPDHIKIHRATVAAFNQSRTEMGESAPQRLYYNLFPRAIMRFGLIVMRLMRKNPRKMGVNGDLDFQAVVDAAIPVHARVNVDAYYQIGMDAAACHASQSSPRTSIPLANLLFRRMMAGQLFHRAYPEPGRTERLETDLFAQVQDIPVRDLAGGLVSQAGAVHA